MAPPLHPPPSPSWPSQRRRGPRSNRSSASRKLSESHPQRLMDIVLGVVSRLGIHNTGVTMQDIEHSTVHDGYLPDRMGTRDLLRYGVMRAVREGRLLRTSGGLYRAPSASRERTDGLRTPCSRQRVSYGHAVPRCPKSPGPKLGFRRSSLTPAAPRSGFRYRRRSNRKSPMDCSPPPPPFPRSVRSLDFKDEIPSFALKEAVLGSMGGNDVDMDDPMGGDWSEVGGRGGGLSRNLWGRDSFRSPLADDLSDEDGPENPFDARPQRRRGGGLNLPKMERRRDGEHGRAAAAALFILASDIVKVIAQKASNKLNNLSLEPRVNGGADGGGTVIGGCEGGGGPGSGGGGLGDGRSGEGGSFGGPDFDFCSNEEGPDNGARSEVIPMDTTPGAPETDVEEAGRVVLQGAAALSEISTHLGEGAARVLNVSSANGGSHTESGEKKEAIFKAFQVAAMDIVRVARVFVNPSIEKIDEDEDGQSPFLSSAQRNEGFTFDDTPRGEVGGGCQDGCQDTSCPSALTIDMQPQNCPREVNTNMEEFVRNLLHDVRLLARRVGSSITH